MKSKYHVTLLEHSEGVSVSCPELPGCHSQGATMAEALENIRDAIQGYLELYGKPDVHCEIHELELTAAWYAETSGRQSPSHLRAVKALEKAGFRIDRQSKHIFMSKGSIHVVVPRNNPVDAYTMGAIVRDAGMSIEQFRDLLWIATTREKGLYRMEGKEYVVKDGDVIAW